MFTSSATTLDVFTGMTDVTTAMPWIPEDVLWLLIVGFIVAFILAFAVGANDVANSFGTSVGAEVLTLRQACILATIFETAGAVLIGAKVGEMIRKGIIDVGVYDFEQGTVLLMMGEVAAMFGSGMWQIIATLLKLPVSGTHSIVGACIGFSLVAVGSNGVNWTNLGLIVASWFVSPVLSGIMAVLLYYVIQRFILNTENPLKHGLRMLPIFYAFTVGINIFSILYSGAPLLGFDNLPVWGILCLSVGGMVVVAIVTKCWAVPRIRLQAENLTKSKLELSDDVEATSSSCSRQNSKTDDVINKGDNYEKQRGSTISDESKRNYPSEGDRDEDTQGTSNDSSGKVVRFHETKNDEIRESETTPFVVQLTSSDSSIDKCGKLEEEERLEQLERSKNSRSEMTKKIEAASREEEDEEEDPPAVRQLFSSLQVLTACFASFAHGGNDVSNAIGPLIALWIIFWSGEVGQRAFTPWYLLLYGGVGISIGLWLLGRRVMETIGKDLTKVTPSRGFCIELMTALTVLLASNLGIPLSTTHCKVGSVVSIGWYRARTAVDWSMVRNIACAWFITVPAAGLFSAGAMYGLMQFL